MRRLKITAIVSGAALTTFGLMGCSVEEGTPADSAGTTEPADQPSEAPAETPDGDAEGGDAGGDAAGGDNDAGDEHAEGDNDATDEHAGGDDDAAGGDDAAGNESPDDDTPAAGDEPGEVVEGFEGKTYSVISTNTLASGIVIDELRIGEGEACPAGATVSIQYHGTLMDGTVFDSTRERGAGGPWALADLIKGWREGVPGMKVGGVRRLTIPYQLGYGEAGSPPKIPGRADLIFIIEMVSFQQ